MVLGAACMVVRAIAVSVLPDPGLVTSTMLLHGAGFAFLTIGGVTYVARHAPVGTAATAQGVLTATVFGLAMIVGPAISGLLAGAFPLPEVFGIASVGSICAVGALTLALSARPPGHARRSCLAPSPEPGPGTLPALARCASDGAPAHLPSMGSWISVTRSADRSTRKALGIPSSGSAPNWR